MIAQIIPFPAVRCRTIVDRAFIATADWNDEAADRHMARVIRQRRKRLEALGVDGSLIETDINALAEALGTTPNKKGRLRA